MAMLGAAKDFPALVHAQARGEWLETPPGGGELLSTRALILGYGGIGRAIGDRLRAFGVDAVGVRRRPVDEAHVLGPDQWRAHIGDYDWVILSAPLTSLTRYMI